MSTEIFTLPQLYYRPGTARDTGGKILAASPGVTSEQMEECRRLAPLLPPPLASHPDGAIGFFRGQTVDFILAHAHHDTEGRPRVQYVLIPADLARQIAGRAPLLQKLANSNVLPDNASSAAPLTFAAPPLPTAEEEVDSLMDFLLTVQDDFQVVENLLAGLIQGVPLSILHGPEDLTAQLAFIQGLLTLLPVPARFGVTFASFARRLEAVPIQIAFVEAPPPAGSLCYDMKSGELLGEPPEDPYSHFIVRQLRLDPQIAEEQMLALTRTAGWRLTRGESLAEALGWAARRAALDAAVTEGQPADSGMVAAVLGEDPTLDDELRVRYARHLLAFALALEDPTPARIIGVQARLHPDVADAALEMLDEAIAEGKTYVAYQMIAGWLADPLGPEGFAWRQRAYQSALAYLNKLAAERDVAAAITFLEELQHVSEAVMIGEAASDLLEAALPLAEQSSELAQILFLLAADHLPAAPFQRLTPTPSFARQLPKAFRAALPHLKPGQPTPAPPGMLARVAAAFGEDWEPVVLGRLVEWTQTLERPDLIDTKTLERLAALARSPWQGRFAAVLSHVVEDLSTPELLTLLEPPGPRYLAEILLQMGDYQGLVALLERASAALFRGDAQINFAPWVSDIFEHTTLDAEQLLTAVETIARLGLKPVPKAMAYRGALLNKQFDPALEPLIRRLSSAMSGDAHLIKVVGYDTALHLLEYHARRKDVNNTVRLAAAITESVGGAQDGLNVIGRIWALLNWNRDVREAALELLRRYARWASPEWAQRIPQVIGKKLGKQVEEMLRATVTVSTMTGNTGLETFAEDVHVAAGLLADILAAYVRKPYPTLKRLRSDLDAMSGGLSDRERDRLSGDLLIIARLVYQLGSARGRGRRRASFEQQLLEGTAAPRSAVDALLGIGGHFSKGLHLPPDLEWEAMHHVTGHRSVSMLFKEADTTRRLLERLLAAFPPGKPPALTTSAFYAEVDSLWKSMRLYDQRRLYDTFAMDTQALATLIGMISDSGDERALNDSGLGRSLESGTREPKSALEVMRFLSGYFGRRFRA